MGVIFPKDNGEKIIKQEKSEFGNRGTAAQEQMGVSQGNTCQLCIGKRFVLQEVSSEPGPGGMGDTAGSEERHAMAQEAGPLWSLPCASRTLTNLKTFTSQSHHDLSGNCSALPLNLN